MAKESLQQAVDTIRKLAAVQEYADLADSVLLERFLTGREEAAFETLVRRYGSMILGVCRRILRNTSDAEDAFQAVFLVLLRKASTIKRRDLLGNWLYGVAYQTARAARAATQRRRAKEGHVTPRQSEPASNDPNELMAVLDEELAKLPELCRTAVVLCDLQELSRKEAATKLGIAEGTLSSRLARGRAMLSQRLTRRGVSAPLAVLGRGLGGTALAMNLPHALVQTTVKTALSVAAGPGAIVGASAQAIKLSETVIKMMFLSKIKVLAPVIAIALGMCFGVRALALRGPGSPAAAEEASTLVLADQTKASEDVKQLVKQSLDAAEAIDDEELRLAVLLRIARAQLRFGEREAALATADKVLAIAKTIDEARHKVIVLTDIAMLQYEADDKKAGMASFQVGEKTALALQNPGEKGNALMDVVRRLSYLKEYDEAFRVAAEAGDFQSSGLMSMAMTIPVTYKKDKSAASLQALVQARTVVQTLGGRGVQALADIAYAQARVGQMQEAMQTADAASRALKDPNQASVGRQNALHRIVRGAAASGDWQGAFETYKLLPKSNRSYDLVADIATAQIRSGKRDEALKSIQELRRLADDVDKDNGQREKVQSPNAGKGMRRGQRQPNQLEIAEPMPDVRPQILARVATLEAKMGDLEAALQTATALPPGLDKARALLEIGKAQCKVGDKVGGKKALRRASRIAVPVPSFGADASFRDRSGMAVGDHVKFNVLHQIAVEQARAGDADGASETLEDITSAEQKGLPSFLLATAEGGDLERARQMLPQIKKMSDRGYVLEGLTRIMSKSVNEKAALALANQQTSPGLKAYAFLGILAGKMPEEGENE